MSGIALKLDQTLSSLDPSRASLLERLVGDALELVSVSRTAWPEGYFEATAGSFAGEPLDEPSDAPPSANEPW